MPRTSPFKHHRFPREIILCAVRWYLRYPLSYQDVVDLLAERPHSALDRQTPDDAYWAGLEKQKAA